MDLNLIYQPEHHFRFFDLCEEPKKIIRSNDDYEQISLVTLEEAVEPLIEFIPQVKDMVKLVKEKCQQPKDNLSIDESASIMLYTIEWIPKENSFYYIFNRKLSSTNQNELIPLYSYLKLISISLSKLSKLSNRIFYRGIQLDFKTQYSLDKIFLWNSYSSCTSSIDIIDQEKIYFNHTNPRTLFIIHSEHGINISEHSFYKIKYEILLPPKQQFQVVSIRQSNTGLCIIILKEIFIELIPTIEFNHEDYKSFDLLFQKKIGKYEKNSEINLNNQKLTDNHLDIIIKYAIQKKKCHWLSLQNNQITSQGLFILSKGLKTNKSLESLYLSKNFINDFGVECLTKILSYSNLTFLSLDHNSIKDKGAQYLADMLKINKILTDLWLSYNEIGNQGVQSLAEVLTFDNQTLIQLYLHGNKLINDLSVNCLIHMLEFNTRLNTIWLQNCNFTQEGKEKLEKTIEYRENFDLYV
jgi:Ran GTPase-activating protein (RanGAP) involved in mRNA processing and transport